MKKVDIKVKKLSEKAIIPKYQTSDSVGFDVHAVVGGDSDQIVLPAGEQRIIGTGLAFSIPEGYELQVRPRSGLAAKSSITVTNSPGTIDFGYLGEVKVILFNLGRTPLVIKTGDRIAQVVVNEVPIANLIEVEELGQTERGTAGFGSTGV